MLHFIDLEASSLGVGSFPIEVGWVAEDGTGESHLVRPEPHWTEWDDRSEKVHGISRETLAEHGRPAAWVARRVLEVLHPGRATAVSDAPDHDGYWLTTLLRAGGGTTLPVLVGLNTILKREVQPMLDRLASGGMGAMEAREAVVGMVRQVEDEERARDRVRHRALPDAEGLRWRWREVRKRASGPPPFGARP